MDFVHDQLFDGRKIRILTVVDTSAIASDKDRLPKDDPA